MFSLDPDNWEQLLEQGNVSPPDQLSRKDYATILQNRIEILFPNDVFRSKYRPIESNSFNRNLEQLAPIFIQNDHLFGHIPFSALDLGNIDDKLRPVLENAYGEINRWVNRYPGLELSKVLTDKALTTKGKLVEAERRVNLLAQFYRANEASSFLFLDYSPDSKDLEQLHLANFTASDRRLILNNLKTDKILYQITNNVEHAYVLKESGFHATYQIASESLNSFVRKTKLPQAIAQQYHRNAKVGIVGIVTSLGTVIDLVKNPLQGSMADNASPEISQYLQRLEGYSTLFGSQDFCKCQHCQSIISPVAYFVDLMDFLKTHILDEYFTGPNAIHPLNPYNRRQDLWDGLPLTCDATHTLVPYLTIILEILENYIFRVRDIHPLDRENVESAVYRFLYEQAEIDNEVYVYSFRQPFCLPLVELQTYLQHFPSTRAEIARTVLAYQQDTAEIIPQAELKVSRREYEMIQSRPLNPANELHTEFLTRLYGFNVASNPEPESKDLFTLMEISRQQLTELVATGFIAANGTRVSFKGSRHDGDDTTLQPDKEVVKGLTPEILDRMHRFVRLWRRLDWSMAELDQILFHIYEARDHSDTDRNQLPLPLITQLHTLQKYLKVSVPELCALFHRIPNDGKGSLCDRLFNLPVFTRSHGGGAAWPSDETVQYPYPSASTDLVTIQRLHRLLAGLGLKDDELFQLMKNLRIPLGGPSEGAFSFTLNLDNLSLLYRHARLTKLLRLDVRELFALLRMAPDIPSNHVSNLETLQSLIDIVSWQKKSGYSIQELASILDDRYAASSSETATSLTPRDISESIVDQILADRSLIFRDTLFSYFEGITEAQSQAIIRANTAVIVPADIRTYRIAATVTDPGTVTISLPSDISSALTDAQRSQLDTAIREIIATYRQPGAPDISDRILVGVAGLTLSQARAIFGENSAIFEPAHSPYFKYQINPLVDPFSVAFDIPVEISSSLASDANSQLISRLEEIVLTHVATESPYIFDEILKNREGLTASQSTEIIRHNNSIFEPVSVYRVRSSVDPATVSIHIPPSISSVLTPEQLGELESAIREFLVEYLPAGGRSFPDAAFEGIVGLTVAQSKEIIELNNDVFESAYRIHSSIDLSSVSSIVIDIPSGISGVLTSEQQSALVSVVRKIITHYLPTNTRFFLDDVLVGTAGLDSMQSRMILGQNPNVFELIEKPVFYWLSKDFEITNNLTIPLGIPLLAGPAQNYLRQFQASEVVAHQLGRQFNLSVEKIKALSLLAGYKLAPGTLGADLTRLLHGDSGYLQVLIDLVTSLKKLSLWFKDKSFDTEALAFIQAQSGGTDKIFHIELELDRKPSLANLQQTVKFQQLLKSLRTSKTKPKHLFLTLLAFDHISLRFDPNRANDQIAALLGADEALIDSLKAAFGAEEGLLNSLNYPELFAASWGTTTSDSVNRALEAFDKLSNCIKLAQFLGIGGEAFELILSEGYADLNQAVAIVVTAIRTKYESEESYQEKIGAFEDQIREQKRDALTDFLIHSDTPEEERIFRSSNDLYHYFLIDTELEGCARTSRVVAGTASLQLYIQRCLMNLEQSEDGSIHVRPRDNPEDEWQWRQEWEWRKNYRVWEANRKVFLFAENYIEPDLRDDKTQLFEETVSELLQKEINAQSVVDAYAKYMKGFEEIAQLNIAGAFHDRDNGADVLHLFGVTASEPPQYYYRTIENIYKSEEQSFKKGVVWNSWQKINLQIPVRKVSPIIYKGKLYVFWVQITTRPKNEDINGTSVFSGYRHTMTVKFSALQLDGTWSSPQTIDLKNEVFENGAGVIDDSLATPEERRFPPNEMAKMLAALMSYVRNMSPEDRETKGIVIETDKSITSVSSLADTPIWRNLLVPKYDPLQRIHAEAIDDYTLTGPRWDQVYPSVDNKSLNKELMLVGRDFKIVSYVDPYTRTISRNKYNSDEYTNSRFHQLAEWKRLYHRGDNLSFGYQLFTVSGSHYSEAVRYLAIGQSAPRPFSLREHSYLMTLRGNNKTIALINGALTDALINIDGDLLYLHSYEKSGKPYAIERLGTTLSETISRQLFENGIEGLLNIDFQSGLAEARLPVLVPRNASLVAPLALDGELDIHGSLGVYFREMFFHIPFLIANHLNSQGKYADAQRWYHYIFDPTSDKLPPGLDSITDPEKRKKHQARRVWQYIEFRDHTLQTLRQQLDDSIAEEAYRKDPFNPHAIARLRLDAYKKSVVMKYIDNLLDWGDQLFTQDTRESINEATLLYIMAAEILGPRPLELGDCRSKDHPDNPTYRQINDQINQPATANFYTEIETLRVNKRSKIPDTGNVKNTRVLSFQTLQHANHINVGFSHNSSIGSFFQGLDWKKVGSTIRYAPSLASFGTSLLKQARIFCIPPNPDLIGYWDRVEDRLYKIRNCMNISGLRRDLALFAPEIDPRLLVRARAEGIPLEDVLDSISGNLPPYRFSFLIIKAKEYTSALQSFGAALLSAIEKKEAEELVRLRLIHQDTILKLSRKLRDQEIEAAEASLESLKLREQIVIARRDHFQSLKDAGLSEWENLQVNTKLTSHGLLLGSAIFMMTGSGLTFAPQILGMSNSTPAKSSADGAIAFAGALQFLSQISNIVSDIAGVQAHFQRREQGWDFSLQQSKGELKELEKQIRGAEIRRDISIQSREIHEKSIEQSEEIYEFYQDKFTNLGLYTWLSTQLQRLYRQAYQDALAVARLAERAFRFERGDDTTPLLSGQYWDATHSGLLAGEKLMGDLRAMELRYMETHYRNMEIDQAFSLTQINPAALITLKETGECSFDIPELYFDLFYPGHYRRRIKSARLTIPCITGPYTNIGATLTLTGSKIRKDPIVGEENLLDVPPTRSVSIATSTAQNDSGVFHLDFRDERYMPFEGAGAISTWKLSLPKSFRQFDYQTINDVILHISYTAQDDGVFRQQIEGSNAEVESEIRRSLQERPLWRAFSLRQEFSNPYNRLLRSAVGEPVKVEFSEKRFPLFLQGAILENLEIQSAQLVLVLNPGQTYGEFSMQINGEPVPAEDPGTEGSSFVNSARFGNSPNLPSIDITKLFSGKVTENLLGSHGSSREHTFIIDDAGDLAPDSPAPSDLSAIDAEKLKDILILIEYRYKLD